MSKKYKFTDEIMNLHGRTLRRIIALKNFNDVKKGDLGGFIEFKRNLSQRDNCWIYDNAIVCDKANVRHDGRVYNNAIVKDNAQVLHNAVIKNDVIVENNAVVSEMARVNDKAVIKDNVIVNGDANITKNVIISSVKDYTTFIDNYLQYEHLTWTKSNNMWFSHNFYGTGYQLVENAYKHSEKVGKIYEEYVKLVEDEINQL